VLLLLLLMLVLEGVLRGVLLMRLWLDRAEQGLVGVQLQLR